MDTIKQTPKSMLEAQTGGDDLVPDKYIHKKASDADQAFDDASLPHMDFPPIDLDLLLSSSEPELHKFRSALTTWGCFQVIVDHALALVSIHWNWSFY